MQKKECIQGKDNCIIGMRLSKTVVICLVISLFLSACTGLKTPEELIGPPQMNMEQKILEDTVRRFLPSNGELITAQEKSVSMTDPVVQTTITKNGDRDVVALYRDKSSRRIGIVILRQYQDLWSKIMDVSLDAYEISDYHILDLNSDGKNEIIIGYFSTSTPFKSLTIFSDIGGSIQKIYQTEYLGFDVGSDSEKGRYIALSTVGSGGRNNRFILMDFSKDRELETSEFEYAENIDIYRITYGKLNEQYSGFFLDMYVDESSGKTDVLSRGDEGLQSILMKLSLPEVRQQIPFASTDINADGMIELVSNRVLPQDDGSTNIILNSYININDQNAYVPLMDVVEDHYNNIKVTLPPLSVWGIENRFFVIASKNRLLLSFQEDDRRSDLVEVVLRSIQDGYDENYTLISERSNMFLLGKKYSVRDLHEADRTVYEGYYEAVGSLAEIVRFME